jgi:hypothetical protein
MGGVEIAVGRPDRLREAATASPPALISDHALGTPLTGFNRPSPASVPALYAAEMQPVRLQMTRAKSTLLRLPGWLKQINASTSVRVPARHFLPFRDAKPLTIVQRITHQHAFESIAGQTVRTGKWW